MAEIIQIPTGINLLRNLPIFIIESSENISFSLHQEAKVLLQETYYRDLENRIEIDVRDVISQHLSTMLPNDRVFEQSSAKASFTAYVNDEHIATFSVISGGVRGLPGTVESWLKANWLTWQPQSKKVNFISPEYLSYYFTEPGKVQAKFYRRDGSTKIVTVTDVFSSSLMTFKMNMSLLFTLSGESEENLMGLVDVWVESLEGVRLSYVQRYIYAKAEGDESYYLCVNSLGGIDTFTFNGARTFKGDSDHRKAEKYGNKINIESPVSLQWSQNTGYLSREQVKWLWEFISSQKRWVMDEGTIEEIVLDTSSISMNERDNLTACSFNYELSIDGDMMRIIRSPEEMTTVEIPTPSGEMFILKGRMSDFPNAELTDELLFLVQQPNTEIWRKIDLAALSDFLNKDIKLQFASSEQIHEIINLLN